VINAVSRSALIRLIDGCVGEMDAYFGPYPLCDTHAVRSGETRTLTPPLEVFTSAITVTL
jgi:hypothetical protein